LGATTIGMDSKLVIDNRVNDKLEADELEEEELLDLSESDVEWEMLDL